MPNGPWVMTQTWHDLLFAHWPIDAGSLRERIPSEFDVDLFDGSGWLAILPFHMTNVAPRGVPSMPWISEFPELNVRTYVRIGDRPADVRETVGLVFRELLLNGIEWGGRLDPAQKVRVACLRTGRMRLYRIADPGPGFTFEGLSHAAMGRRRDL